MARVAQAGDRVLLIDRRHKRHIITLEPGKAFHTDRGVISHDALIGRPYGRQVHTHLGEPFTVLRPSIADLAKAVRRTTQIVYPKDSGYILMRMNVGAGARIIEGGTGSGSLTVVLAHAVMPTGHVYTYERRPEMSALAARNLAKVGLDRYVTLHVRDIRDGFVEDDVDGIFLDVREPWLYLEQVTRALSSGGFFGALLPTTNQVSALLAAMHSGPWCDVDVVELLLRRYKPNPERLRPEDRMVAHTAFLVFARYVISGSSGAAPSPPPQEHTLSDGG
ncbi:MAG: tRNA (adenine-N1)-methyltransferase [Ardenticatenia bacterium]|nr:tRNA (adenine-N1)-methyltransferase [Ardenticatenia bacterium]